MYNKAKRSSFLNSSEWLCDVFQLGSFLLVFVLVLIIPHMIYWSSSLL